MGAYLKGGRLFRFSIFGLDNHVVVEVTGDGKLKNDLIFPGQEPGGYVQSCTRDF